MDMNLTERVSYLKGLMDGLSIADTTPEGKLFKAIIDVLDEMAESVTLLEDDVDEMFELADEIDADLAEVEKIAYDEEDFYEIECPECGEIINIDEDLAEEGQVVCPVCGEDLEFDLDDLIDDCDCGCEDCK